MKTAIVKIKNKEEERFLKALFKKVKIKARFLTMQEMEDSVFARLIDEGMKSRTVSKASVMKLLNKNGD